jgi:hypothetical protein
MRRFPLAVCSLFLFGLIASGFWATRATKPQEPEQVREISPPGMVPDLTMRDMAIESTMIVTGQCIGTRSTWVERTLYTLATVSVSDTIKGEPSSTVTVALPGGIDPNRKIAVAMTFPGAPIIRPQEKVFLFLRPAVSMAGSYSVMGYSQGKLSIVENEQGVEMVSRSQTMPQINSAAGIVRGNIQMTNLAEFKKKVKEYLR